MVSTDGGRDTRHFPTKAKAATVKRDLEAQIITEEHTTETAKEAYEEHLTAKGNKARSRYCTLHASENFPLTPFLYGDSLRKKCKA